MQSILSTVRNIPTTYKWDPATQRNVRNVVICGADASTPRHGEHKIHLLEEHLDALETQASRISNAEIRISLRYSLLKSLAKHNPDMIGKHNFVVYESDAKVCEGLKKTFGDEEGEEAPTMIVLVNPSVVDPYIFPHNFQPKITTYFRLKCVKREAPFLYDYPTVLPDRYPAMYTSYMECLKREGIPADIHRELKRGILSSKQESWGIAESSATFIWNIFH